MFHRSSGKALFASGFLLLTAHTTAAATPAGSAAFILDGNRIYARVDFVAPNGSVRGGLAYVDTGAPRATASRSLLDELHVGGASTLTIRIGRFAVPIDPALLDVASEPPRRLDGWPVDVTLPASVLSHYEVIADYGRRRLTIAAPNSVKPFGISTPFLINPATGIVAVDASIQGKSYPVSVDLGSAWTWFRQSQLKSWLAANPRWARGVGAVGPSNMMMVGDLEAGGILARIPAVRIGAVQLKNVDVLGPGPTKAFPFELFDWYSRKNAVPVLGWIGGNVLKQFRLTIDYPHRILYWQRETPPDASELNEVGVVLRRDSANYVIAGIATKNGRASVEGVQPGDVLLAVDDNAISRVSLGTVFKALRGRPGERRVLKLLRGNRTITIPAAVTAF